MMTSVLNGERYKPRAAAWHATCATVFAQVYSCLEMNPSRYGTSISQYVPRKPELLKRWFGPRGWSLIVCEVDFRVGGGFRFILRSPEGNQMGIRRSISDKYKLHILRLSSLSLR
jgi:hypothetical protein